MVPHPRDSGDRSPDYGVLELEGSRRRKVDPHTPRRRRCQDEQSQRLFEAHAFETHLAWQDRRRKVASGRRLVVVANTTHARNVARRAVAAGSSVLPRRTALRAHADMVDARVWPRRPRSRGDLERIEEQEQEAEGQEAPFHEGTRS